MVRQFPSPSSSCFDFDDKLFHRVTALMILWEVLNMTAPMSSIDDFQWKQCQDDEKIVHSAPK
jgi:hypothetical protein